MLKRALLVMVLMGCGQAKSTAPESTSATTAQDDGVYEAPPLEDGQAETIFAGGCFWCMESSLEKLPGVIDVVSGYTGGPGKVNYQQIGTGRTGHYEAVRVIYDPTKTDYPTLLDAFWHNIDPTQGNGQFCDRGPQYRSAIFVDDPEQKALAEKTKAEAGETLNADIVTEILPISTFWVAEEYHQDFYKKKPVHYTRYRTGCGRDARLKQLWGDAAGH